VIEILAEGDLEATDPARCQFALCQREAEVAVDLDLVEPEPVLVCALHVTPVVMWGRPDGERTAAIRDLRPRRHWAC
jgi:hypothetical protein